MLRIRIRDLRSGAFCILDPWIPEPDPGAGSRSRIPDPRSATLGEINLFQFVMINWSIGHSIFNFKTTLSPDEHKTIFHFLIINSRSQISDPDFYPSQIPVSDTRSRIQQQHQRGGRNKFFVLSSFWVHNGLLRMGYKTNRYCAAQGTFRYFELCSICLREGLGRSKPATNP